MRSITGHDRREHEIRLPARSRSIHVEWPEGGSVDIQDDSEAIRVRLIGRDGSTFEIDAGPARAALPRTVEED